ncbi:MAG: hypothetical protein WCR12_09780, partial [Dysgonamonadaceae bacterium]
MKLRIFITITTLLGIIISSCSRTYYPPSDLNGGWRTLKGANEINEKAGIDIQKLDDAFEYIKGSTKNGGL